MSHWDDLLGDVSDSPSLGILNNSIDLLDQLASFIGHNEEWYDIHRSMSKPLPLAGVVEKAQVLESNKLGCNFNRISC